MKGIVRLSKEEIVVIIGKYERFKPILDHISRQRFLKRLLAYHSTKEQMKTTFVKFGHGGIDKIGKIDIIFEMRSYPFIKSLLNSIEVTEIKSEVEISLDSLNEISSDLDRLAKIESFSQTIKEDILFSKDSDPFANCEPLSDEVKGFLANASWFEDWYKECK